MSQCAHNRPLFLKASQWWRRCETSNPKLLSRGRYRVVFAMLSGGMARDIGEPHIRTGPLPGDVGFSQLRKLPAPRATGSNVPMPAFPTRADDQSALRTGL